MAARVASRQPSVFPSCTAAEPAPSAAHGRAGSAQRSRVRVQAGQPRLCGTRSGTAGLVCDSRRQTCLSGEVGLPVPDERGGAPGDPVSRDVGVRGHESGTAVSVGSDARPPRRVGDRFKLAVDIVEAAGFTVGRRSLRLLARVKAKSGSVRYKDFEFMMSEVGAGPVALARAPISDLWSCPAVERGRAASQAPHGQVTHPRSRT
jgi:hypothetical protein